MANPFKSKVNPKHFSRPEGAGNFDNMDDHNVVKTTSLLQGTIQHTPTADKDIANKKYVDDKNVESLPTTLTSGSVVFSNGSNLTQDNDNLFWDDTNNRLGIKTKSPTATLDLMDGNGVSFMGGADLNANPPTRTDNTRKVFRIGASHYNNNEEPVALLFSDSDNGTSLLDYGGGTSLMNAATRIQFWTAANNSTTSGTKRMLIGASGYVRFPNDNQHIQIGDSTTDLELYSDGTDGHIDTNGKLIINSTTEIAAKTKMTSIGGIAVKLTNKSGANSVAGNLVIASGTTDDAVTTATAGDVDIIGVFLDSGISDGSEAWVVFSGIADVMMEDNTASTRGNWVAMSRGENAVALNQASPATAPQHFEEIGHCIESVAAGGAGTNILARCVLHFN